MIFFLHCRLFFRTINGFLNTGKGGVVYLGIIDSGAIRGIQLTQYQVSNVEVAFPQEFKHYKNLPIYRDFFQL